MQCIRLFVVLLSIKVPLLLSNSSEFHVPSRSEVFCTVSTLRLLVRMEKRVQGQAHPGDTTNQGRRPNRLPNFQWACHVRFLYKL